MGKIKVLSENLSNRIAAGEVIERPASVVKELVENAIDAGAGRIRVEIERFGTKLIRVTDDGEGMDADDLLMALEPHGTSKIQTDRDIENISTLGFRGEAIPSIGSISNFAMCSRTRLAAEGNEVTVRGGKFMAVTPIGTPRGTKISVRDLFFNIPARKKFLKSAATEENHIQERFLMMALPNPQVHFELVMDNRRIYELSAGDLLNRISDTLGKDFASHLLKVDYTEGVFHIYGYLAQPGFSRTSRREQRTFVNRRAVESNTIFRAIKDGYEVNEASRFQPCVLFVDMPPDQVDVNVHPAKREVRFKNDFLLSHIITRAIKNALQNSPIPGSTLDKHITLQSIIKGAEINYNPAEHATQESFTELTLTSGNESPEKEKDSWLTDQHEEDNTYGELNPFNCKEDLDIAPPPTGVKLTLTQHEAGEKPASNIVATNPATGKVAPPASAVVTAQPEIPHAATAPEKMVPPAIQSSPAEENKFLGFLNATYILAQTQEGLIIIDQHAAHERVIFEQLLRQSQAKDGVAAQKLLIPLTVELSRNDAKFIQQNLDIFQQLGFDLDLLSSNTVIVEALPSFLPTGNI
ncbi:MAG: DNA mismatch repair endonuclease MutL, partial [Victivallaceae bacterium]